MHAESTFRVDGLHCRDEITLLERRLTPVAGVESLSADLVGGRLRVAYDAAVLSPTHIADAVAETGMRAWLEDQPPPVAAGRTWRSWSLALCSVLLAAGWAGDLLAAPAAWTRAAYLLAASCGVIVPALRAVAALRGRVLDINALMVMAVLGAMAIGEESEAATVVFLFALSQWLEARSLDRVRRSVQALMTLTPPTARVRTSQGDRELPVSAIAPGAIVLVQPGERVPLDGHIVGGRSAVDQSPITGESMPVAKSPGASVFAGSINGDGALDIRVTHGPGDTTLARIIHLVEQAQSERAPSQQFIDRFARRYTPVVIAVAACIAIVPPLVGGGEWPVWIYRGLVLLVVACPCALVISTPVAVVAAIAAAARRGVLIKGGAHLERLAAVRALAFDKTGTLTTGQPRVVAMEPLSSSADDLLRLAASVESRSGHPLAAAVSRAAREAGLTITVPRDAIALPGQGVEATVDGEPVACGSASFFRERGWMSPEAEQLVARLAEQGMTPVLIARRGLVAGALGIADQLRDASAAALQQLRAAGIQQVAMVTGDDERVAGAIAGRLGIEHVHAQLLPAQKVDGVKMLRRAAGPVAMVGDGVNDAPALAAADVGIAMGAAGSDAALETADVALMHDDLGRLPYLFRLGRATVRTIRVNVAVSLVSKAAVLGLAIAGTATLWMAIVADTGVSLLVVANALRLLRSR